jgi:hypothetical protein
MTYDQNILENLYTNIIFENKENNLDPEMMELSKLNQEDVFSNQDESEDLSNDKIDPNISTIIKELENSNPSPLLLKSFDQMYSDPSAITRTISPNIDKIQDLINKLNSLGNSDSSYWKLKDNLIKYLFFYKKYQS